MDTPFFMWSIADACSWLVHIPVLGFILLAILALIIIGVGVWIGIVIPAQQVVAAVAQVELPERKP